jgi:acyl-CoA thioesterase-1
VAVLLVGLEIPPNYGPDYARRFGALFPRLAAEYEVPLVPFLLERVAGEESFNLADRIHPNAEGHRILAETVAPHLRPLVAEAAAESADAAK